MSELSPVGLIGVGLMGQVFARRLMDAGFGVVGYNVDPQRGKQLAAIGFALSAPVMAQKATGAVLDATVRVAGLRDAGLVPTLAPNVSGWPSGNAWYASAQLPPGENR